MCTPLLTKELENSRAASCLLIPQLDNVDVYNFTVDWEVDRLLGGFTASVETPYPPPEAMRTLTGLPDDKQVKLVLLWNTENWYRLNLNSDLGYALLKHYDGHCVIAGGHVDTLLPDDISLDTNNTR